MNLTAPGMTLLGQPAQIAGLNYRQSEVYTYRVSLYKPATLAPDTAGDIEANQSFAPAWVAAYTDVPCLYSSTPEVDEAMIQGLSPELNLFTLDSFRFAISQPVADTWKIVMTGSDPAKKPHVYIGRVWTIRDNSRTLGSQGERETDEQMVYAVLEDVPGLSTLVAGIS